MATVAELLAEYRAQRVAACAILESSPVLVEKWTMRPSGGGEGEEGWSPEEVGSHMVFGEWWMMENAINAALTAGVGPLEPDLRQASLEVAAFHARLRRLQQGYLRLPGPADAAQALAVTGQQSDRLLGMLSDEHLALAVQISPSPGPVANGVFSVEQRVLAAIDHTRMHVGQLRDFFA